MSSSFSDNNCDTVIQSLESLRLSCLSMKHWLKLLSFTETHWSHCVIDWDGRKITSLPSIPINLMCTLHLIHCVIVINWD